MLYKYNLQKHYIPMKKFALASLAFLVPAFAFAASGGTVDSAQALSSFIISFINNILVPLVFAISFLFFIWGVFTYFIRGASNEEKRKESRNIIIFSVIGFAAMISIWGLVHILVGTISLDNTLPSTGNGLPKAPQTGA